MQTCVSRSAKAPARAVREIADAYVASAYALEDLGAFACLSAATRATGICIPAVDHQLHRCLREARALGADPMRERVTQTLRWMIGAASRDVAFEALAHLGPTFARWGQPRRARQLVVALLAAGALDRASEVAALRRGFERRQLERMVATGCLPDPRCALGHRFVARLTPEVVACLTPTPSLVEALARAALVRPAPWIEEASAEVLHGLPERARADAAPYVALLRFATAGPERASRVAMCIRYRSGRRRAFALLNEAARIRGGARPSAQWLGRIAPALTEPQPTACPPKGRCRASARAARDWVVRSLERAFAGWRAEPAPVIAEVPSDLLSIERARFDESRVLEGRVSKSIVRSTRRCLRLAVSTRPDLDPELVHVRLRTLLHVGGARATGALEQLLEAAERPGAAVESVLETLAVLEPGRARIAFGRHLRLFVREPGASRVVAMLEVFGALDEGFGARWAALRERVSVERYEIAVEAWLIAAAEAWQRAGFGPPSKELADTLWLASEDATSPNGELLATPQELLDRLLDELAFLDDAAPRDLFAQLDARRARLLRLLFPAPRAARMGPTPLAALEAGKRLLDSYAFQDDEALISSTLDTPAQARALTRGVCPVPPAATVELEGGARLRYLDKRRDLLAFLRFADTVPCCLSSTAGSVHMDVLFAWRDPLTFCFTVERRTDAGLRPLGFVLGGFARVGRTAERAVVFNGIYLARRSAALRARIVEALEERFVRPLGVRHVGMAAVYGGAGPLPERYQRRATRMTRLRALREGAGQRRTREIYDDVSFVANAPVTVHHVHWATL